MPSREPCPPGSSILLLGCKQSGPDPNVARYIYIQSCLHGPSLHPHHGRAALAQRVTILWWLRTGVLRAVTYSLITQEVGKARGWNWSFPHRRLAIGRSPDEPPHPQRAKSEAMSGHGDTPSPPSSGDRHSVEPNTLFRLKTSCSLIRTPHGQALPSGTINMGNNHCVAVDRFLSGNGSCSGLLTILVLC